MTLHCDAAQAVIHIIQGRRLIDCAEQSAALVALGGDPNSSDTIDQQREIVRTGLLLAITQLREAERLLKRGDPEDLRRAADHFARQMATLARGTG
jgi:hypothetical protein